MPISSLPLLPINARAPCIRRLRYSEKELIDPHHRVFPILTWGEGGDQRRRERPWLRPSPKTNMIKGPQAFASVLVLLGGIVIASAPCIRLLLLLASSRTSAGPIWASNLLGLPPGEAERFECLRQ